MISMHFMFHQEDVLSFIRHDLIGLENYANKATNAYETNVILHAREIIRVI